MYSLVSILVGTLCCVGSIYLITHGQRVHWLGLLGIGLVVYGTCLSF